VRRGTGQVQSRRFAERLEQLVVHDLHDLLGRRQALHDLGADCPLAHARNELLDDPEVHIGLEQGQPHLAQRGVDVLLCQPPVGRQLIENGVEFAL